jgi:hypothetical protein
VAYTIIKFEPSTEEAGKIASYILAREKIPFHAVPSQWITSLDIIKVIMVIIAAYVSWPKSQRLSLVLITSLFLAIISTAIFSWLDNDFLLLLFPWRVSAVLAPISLIIIIATLANSVPDRWRNIVLAHRRALFVCVMLLAGTIQIMKIVCGYPGFIPRYWMEYVISNDAFDEKVEDRRQRMQVTNWAKSHDASTDIFLIPLNFEQFRIKSGRPIFVDWKSHPFKDIEVIEWKRRIDIAAKTYRNLRECNQIKETEFNIIILDDSLFAYRCALYEEKRINERFGYIKLR